MRRLNRLATALLILLSAAGIAVGVLFLRREGELSAQRQARVSKLAEDLLPITEKRKEWQSRDKEWQARLEEQRKGKSCILLSFDNMETNLYETIYDMMEQYGFRATFTLRNGRLPSSYDEEGYITSEELDEILHDGWEYAISIGDERVMDEDGEYVREEETAESETGETEEASPEKWIDQIDSFLARLDEAQMTRPETVYCTQEQFAEATAEAIAQRGFRMACVVNEDEFPYIAERDETLWRIDSGLYKQKDSDLESFLETAIANKESVAISINEVMKISRDAEYDLSLTKFSSLLNYLKNMEEQGMVNIMTYSEFYQHEEQQEQEYNALVAEYAVFKQEMTAEMAELDSQEQKLVEESRSTEVQE